MNRVALKITKIWLRLGGKKVLRVSTIQLPGGREEKVVVFTGDTYDMVGQVTPWGTILVHEFAFSIEKLHDYVVAHESAHKRQWFRYFLYPLITLWMILPVSCGLFVLMVIQAIITQRTIFLETAITILISSALLLAIPSLFSWIIEFQADCYAIRKVGISNILDAIKEGRALAEERGCRKPDRFSIILTWLTHPPLSLTYRVCRLLHRNEIDPALSK